MRIEKISDNQIRCFLSKEEMDRRQIHLKELAYGTEKARALFQELMKEARARFGFEIENMPVMVEAVPLNDDSLVLIVTRVDNPEELDTRFSSFSPSVKSGADDADPPAPSALSQLLDAIRQEIGDGDSAHKGPSGISPKKSGKASLFSSGKKAAEKPKTTQTQLYTFPSLGEAAAAASAAPGFRGKSSLYRDPADSTYYLFLTPSETDTSYTSVLSTLSEFGKDTYVTPAREQYLREHCEIICAEEAVLKLSELSRD